MQVLDSTDCALIESWIPWAIRVACLRRPRHLELGDAVGESMLALVLAVKTFDPALGGFGKYVEWKIRGRLAALGRKEERHRRRIGRYRVRLLWAGPLTESGLAPVLDEAPDTRALLATLDPTARDIVELRLGIDGRRPRTWGEIGLKYRRSREWARLAYVRALEGLRARCGA